MGAVEHEQLVSHVAQVSRLPKESILVVFSHAWCGLDGTGARFAAGWGFDSRLSAFDRRARRRTREPMPGFANDSEHRLWP